MSDIETTNELEVALWESRCETLFHVQVQLRYHRRRQRFFDLVDKITKSVSTVIAATLLGQSLKEYLPYLASAVTGLGLLALVFGYGDRKQQHKELAEQAASLISAIVRVPASQLTEVNVAGFAADRANLLSKSPPPLKTLSVICEHEQACADGKPDHIHRPCFCKRLIADFFS